MPIPNYVVNTKINKPVADVFRAIVDPRTLEKYFVDRTESGIAPGKDVIWTWEKWGDYPVKVLSYVEDRLIELEIDSTHWRKTTGAGYKVLIRFELQEVATDETLLSVSESGWPTDEAGLKASHENCAGWTHMTLCMKAWLEHGIDLRAF